ncbi:MAG: arsenate reductase (glutaredoxin) [Actinobacteria bacterium]|nr:arsenate reductase (glutaredoxin) [Actinomycetota bacterium]
MDPVTVFHNPRCSKSRGALELLRARGIEPVVVEYLKDPLDRAGLERILGATGVAPAALVRNDGRFRELGLDRADCATREQVVGVLLAHPELMERPVVFVGERAVIARPPEKVAELLD